MKQTAYPLFTKDLERSIMIKGMTSTLDFTEQKKRKREYSKKGCKECKRRKIKCNEAHPTCHECARLNKVCSYPAPGEKVLRVSKKALGNNYPKSPSTEGSSPKSPIQNHTPNQGAKGTSQPNQPNSPASESLSKTYSQNAALNPIPTQSPYIHPAHDQHVATHGFPTRTPFAVPMYPTDSSTANSPYSIPPQSRFGPPTNHATPLPPISPAGFSALNNSRIPPSSINNLLNEAKSPVAELRTHDSPETVSSRGPESPNPTRFDTEKSSYQTLLFQNNNNHITNNPSKSGSNSAAQSNDGLIFLDNYHFFNQEDLNVLANDLNNIVTDIMFEFKYDDKVGKSDPEIVPRDQISQKNDEEINRPKKKSEPEAIPRGIPFDFIAVTKSHEKLYLEEFYNEFANVILPFNAYNESLKSYYNPARDILFHCASQESFLLAAILAQGAKSSFNKNNLPEDEEAYCSYLYKCLKLLGPALGGNATDNNKATLTSNIEAVLLTVLLLTSSNASNTKQNWRPHLRGAKDLLLKIASSKIKIRNSPTLVFCKFWFISIEILAGLSSKLGGTLKSDAELDLLLTCGDEYEINALKDLGLILDNGFNLIGGYHNNCVLHLRDLIKILNKMRADQKSFVALDVNEYIRLLSEFHIQGQIEFINRKCILSTDDFKDGEAPIGNLLDPTTVQKEKIIISWMDLSQQCYCLASKIIIFTKFLQLSHKSQQVQTLTEQLISLISFLGKTTETPQLIKCSILMIQWPMLVAGMNCEKEEHKFLIMKFFRASAHIGSGSAGFALRKINKVWSLHESTVNTTDSEDEIDIVSY